jgi:hypothetical protein
VLCPSKAVCAERIKSRDGTTYDRFDDLHDAFAAAKGFEANTVTDTAAPADLATRIRKGLSKGLYRIN